MTLSILVFLRQYPLDLFEAFLQVTYTLPVDLVLFQLLSRYLVVFVVLLDRPDLGNIIFDLFEPFVALEKGIRLVGVVNVRVVFPLDMEALYH